MFKSILVPSDGSYIAQQAVAKAVEFAKTQPGCKIVALAVAEPVPTIASESEVWVSAAEKLYGVQGGAAEDHAQAIAAAAEAAGIPCEMVVTTSVRPWKEIVGVANDKGCDCIVMASHGRKGYDALILGSNANKVLAHSQVPVLVFRPVMNPDDVTEAEGAQWDYMGF